MAADMTFPAFSRASARHLREMPFQVDGRNMRDEADVLDSWGRLPPLQRIEDTCLQPRIRSDTKRQMEWTHTMELPELFQFARRTRDLCTEAVGNLGRGTRGTALIFVQKSLAFRVNRLHAAIDLLVEDNLPSEAAIVELTLFETRLDVLYISSDEARANHWLFHADDHRHPWSVRQKIEGVYSDPQRQKGQRELFSFLSRIKHGNPQAGTLGFGWRNRDGAKTSSNREENDSISYDFRRLVLHTPTLQLLETTVRAVNVISKGVGVEPHLAAGLNHHGSVANELIEPLVSALDARARIESAWVTPSVLMANLERWGPIG